jgi:spermidine synthase
VRFLDADDTRRLDVPDAGVDLLVSLYAGPVWEHCRRYLRPGGWLLANTSQVTRSWRPSTRRCARGRGIAYTHSAFAYLFQDLGP